MAALRMTGWQSPTGVHRVRKQLLALNIAAIVVAVGLWVLTVLILNPQLIRPSTAGVSCGDLVGRQVTSERRRQWIELDCDSTLQLDGVSLVEAVENRHDSERAVHMTLRHRSTQGVQQGQDSIRDSVPVIAIVTASKSPQEAYRVTDTLLVTRLLASLPQHLDPGFEYWVYVAYDAGDHILDHSTSHRELSAWFEDYVSTPSAADGIHIQLRLLRFTNSLAQPGPAFNFGLASAFADGADYFYRVNDDTVFATAFAGPLVSALKAMDPPNVGVVGPASSGESEKVLTHDMTHRTHLEIFEPHYYPPVLVNYWLDNWITQVYGGLSDKPTGGPKLRLPTRAQRVTSVKVLHDSSNRRYDIVAHPHSQVDEEVVRGIDAVVEWLESEDCSVKPIEAADVAAAEFQQLRHVARTKLSRCAFSAVGCR